MNPIERFQKINYLLQELTIVPRETFLNELEISLATFKRDLEYLRDRFNAPIIYDRDAGGYKFDKPNAGKKFELPGLWFSQEEATALLTMENLLGALDPSGLIGQHIRPLRSQIDSILGGTDTSSNELRQRIKFLTVGKRKATSEFFSTVANALLTRKRLNLTFYSKDTGQISKREISPQRLIYYRDNWYLDAYCHLRNDIRSFSLDGIKQAFSTNENCIEISNKKLDAVLTEGYGIFSGEAKNKVVLKFTEKKARWVSTEIWHPQQTSKVNEDGSYELTFMYSNDTELIMDILKHGSEVEVLEPRELRNKIKLEHQKAFNQYV